MLDRGDIVELNDGITAEITDAFNDGFYIVDIEDGEQSVITESDIKKVLSRINANVLKFAIRRDAYELALSLDNNAFALVSRIVFHSAKTLHVYFENAERFLQWRDYISEMSVTHGFIRSEKYWPIGYELESLCEGLYSEYTNEDWSQGNYFGPLI